MYLFNRARKTMGPVTFGLSGLAIVLTLATVHITSAAAPTVTPTPPPPTWQISEQVANDSSDKPPYTITISMPVLASGGADVFNKAVQSFIDQAEQDFKKNAADTTGAPADFSSSLDIRYDILGTSQGIISVLFSGEEYLAGAAHPSHFSSSLNFDLRSGKLLKLADLFQPNSKYLGTIAKLTVADLTAEGRLLFLDGAKATADNYAVWNIMPGGVLITLDEYQVGPYAQGPSKVFIPYTSLGDLLNDDFVFAS